MYVFNATLIISFFCLKCTFTFLWFKIKCSPFAGCGGGSSSPVYLGGLSPATSLLQVSRFFFFFMVYNLFFYFEILFIYFYSVTIVCLFSPSLHPTPAEPPPSPTSALPLDFVLVSFLVAPIDPSPHYPLPTPLWLLLHCS